VEGDETESTNKEQQGDADEKTVEDADRDPANQRPSGWTGSCCRHS
jgi:hypothetical protein